MSTEWDPAARVQLRPGVELAPADEGRWQVRWDFDEVLFLSGAACDRLLPWLAGQLDGSRTLAELEGDAAARGLSVDFAEIVGFLKERRFVAPCIRGAFSADALDAAIAARGHRPAACRDRLSATPLAVVGDSPLAARIALALMEQGFGDVARAGDLDGVAPDRLLVAVETDCTAAGLEACNRRRIADGRQWMLVGAWNRRVLVGPLFISGETACYECYRRRLDSHRAHLAAWRALDRVRQARAVPTAPGSILPALAQLTAGFVAIELFHFVTGTQPARTIGNTIVFQPGEMELAVEAVLRVPWCPACGVSPPQSSPD